MSQLLNNRYRVLETIASGGFGHTFLVEDIYLPSKRRCVLKQLKPVASNSQDYQAARDRFEREAAILEQLGAQHPQIPQLYAYFSEAGQFYLVQEWIPGKTLAAKLESGETFDEAQVRQILISLLGVVEYVHQNHVIHRDIKPSNIILRDPDELPILIDFGAVKEAISTMVNSGSHTAVTMAVGTPGYMPSEQAAGRPTYTSDLYSLGLTAIFMLTGKKPYQLESDPRTGEILWRRSAPNLHSHLSGVIDKAIRYSPQERFLSARQMRESLGENTNSMSQTLVVAPHHSTSNNTTNQNTQHTLAVTPSSPQPLPQKRWLILLGAMGGVFLLGAVVMARNLFSRPRESPPTISQTPETTQEKSSPEIDQDNSCQGQNDDCVTSNPLAEEPISTPAPVVEAPPPIPAEAPPQLPSEVKPANTTPLQPSPIPIPSPSQVTPSPTATANPIPQSSPPEEKTLPEESTTTPLPLSTVTKKTSPEPSTPVNPTPQENNLPGFATGTQQEVVQSSLGKPTKNSKGYWGDTRALLYEDYIPNQVSLGYLFDRNSGRLRQTEASFSQSVELETMSGFLQQMLGKSREDIEQELAKVYQRQSNSYTYQLTHPNGQALKGVIERNQQDRIYIGVWEADLH